MVSMKRVWRTIEWLLAVAWPIVAYQEVFKRYGWKSEYYNQWGEIWFAFALLVPMVGPVLVKLFSGSMEAQKRVALIGLMTVGVGLAIIFRPDFGGLSVMGFFIPIGLHALAVFLWLGWRSKKPLPVKQATEGASAWRDAA
jgi:hypothetical protein